MSSAEIRIPNGASSGAQNMMEVRVPDLGDFKDVPIIEVHVQTGVQVQVDDPLITLESDKASIDVPSPAAGIVNDVRVANGNRVSSGDLILTLRALTHPTGSVVDSTSARAAKRPVEGGGDYHAEVLVLGAGPGGYTAAFRAADLGKKVILVDRWSKLGGVCLNVGCIPSKALLHAAKVIGETRQMAAHGLGIAVREVDLEKLGNWKDSIVQKLTTGLVGLAKQRRVSVIYGQGRFTSVDQLRVSGTDGIVKTVNFQQAIIAAGSEPVTLPFMPHGDPRVIDSTGALELSSIPNRLLVVGGGIIGLEMATVYQALGSRVTVVEFMDQILPGADKDLVAPLMKRLTELFENIYLETKVAKVDADEESLRAYFEGRNAPQAGVFDKVLVAVGRRPNGQSIGAENAGVLINERGFIPVDRQMRTNVPHIFAIGDIVGQPMLAHKAVHEGKIAAEAAAGHDSVFDAKVIPSVAYTDPEVAWVGLTENEARATRVKYGKGVFPWAASGRSLSLGRDEGITKVLFDEATGRILGCGIVGPSAGDLIAEAALAIEMGADARDIGLTIHAHPTLSETICMAAEAFEGTITDLFMPKRAKVSPSTTP